MDFALTAEQTAIKSQARGLAAKFSDEYWAERDQLGEFPQEFYDAFAAGGWLGIAIPEEYGGGGQGVLEAESCRFHLHGTSQRCCSCRVARMCFRVTTLNAKTIGFRQAGNDRT